MEQDQTERDLRQVDKWATAKEHNPKDITNLEEELDVVEEEDLEETKLNRKLF
jgi:cytochrome b involved in lipid metabolism